MYRINPIRLGIIFVIFSGLSLLLAACGDSPAQQAGPPPTPVPNFRQELNQDLFFIMSVPTSWSKKSDGEAVSFVSPEDSNYKMSVSVAQASRLTSDSTRILQEKLDGLKTRFPLLRQDNAGLLKLVDSTVSLFKLTYTDNGLDVAEFVAQVNVPLADRAYILTGRSASAQAEQRKSVFTTSFESFKSNAPLTVPATQTAAAGGDPTAIALSAGGKITGAPAVGGKATDLVDWQSPQLLYGSNRFTFFGLFPLNWQWRIKSFPTLARDTATGTATGSPTPELANPGLYLTAPDNETFIQLGIVPNVFNSDNPPTGDDYKRAYEPYYQSFKRTIESQGSRNSISDIANVGALFRATFIARNESGATNSRGVLFIRAVNRHLLMATVTLGPNSAIKQNLVDGYEADLQQLVLSFKATSTV